MQKQSQIAVAKLSLYGLLLILFSVPAFSQTGTILGVVVDGDSGETLIGANVFLEGTTIGSQTDIDGRYTISKVAIGSYNLTISYIGFNSTTITNIQVGDGEIVRYDVALIADALTLEEVVVEARAARNNDATLLRVRQKSIAVSDAISAESISRSGSSDAADAMAKVTGASVVGGKYVFVRGLGARYSSTHLNGVELPTADPDKKAVQFDMFPSNLLDNIVTIKTFTPDKPGNFSGGLVDIGTKTFPDELNVKISASSSVNTQTHFTSDFLSYKGGKTDWLATDDGTRSVPELLAPGTIEIPTVQGARANPELAAQLDAFSKSFNNVMAPTSGNAPVNSNYSLSIGNQKSLIKRPIGFIVGLTYSNSSSFYDDGTTGRYSFSGKSLVTDMFLNDAKSTRETSLGGLANVTYKFRPNHELGINTTYSRSADATARIQQGIWPKENLIDTTAVRTNRYLTYTERQMMSGQLRGKHHFNSLARSILEWTVNVAETQQEEPDRRLFVSNERTVGTARINSVTSSGFSDPSRYFRNLNENSVDSKVDLSIPFKNWSTSAAKLKLGAAMQYADRDFSERVFTISPATSIKFDGDSDSFFEASNMGVVGYDSTRGQYLFGHVVKDESKDRNNYSGDRSIVAGYAMLELPVTSEFKVITGARLETTEIEIISRDSSLDRGSISVLDILPSLNIVYNLSDNMNLRAAYSNTLARPTFREISPFASFDFSIGDFRIGNPELDRTRISNYDLRWEWFVGPSEILAISLFYKDMTNPIEEVIIGGTNGQLQYQNVDEASVAGIELELRKSLAIVGRLAKNISTGVNLSLITSKVAIAETELVARQKIDSTASARRELQGQSPYIVNADLSYDNYNSGTTIGLYYNLFGRRLSNVSLGGTPDVYEQPSPQLDLTISQQLPGPWAAKISAKNLLDSSYKLSHDFEGEEFVYQEYTRGRSFGIGVSYTP